MSLPKLYPSSVLSGIFKACHNVVQPNPYFENCVFDQCGTGGSPVSLCQAIESYADLCAQAGVPINWRNNTFCRKCLSMGMRCASVNKFYFLVINEVNAGIFFNFSSCISLADTFFHAASLNLHIPFCDSNCLMINCSPLISLLVSLCPSALKCPVGSHYEYCATACPPSCQDPGSASTCTQPCVEGCVCDKGLILSGDKCVPFSQCGCTDKNSNYRPVCKS